MATYTKEIFDAVCDEIAKGRSLRAICKADDMPSDTSVLNWLRKDSEQGDGHLVAQYARAREMQADAIFDECLDIADDAVNDIIETADGQERVNHENVQRSRLRIDTRKWMAGKLKPKKYGESSQVKLTDGEGGSLSVLFEAVNVERKQVGGE